MSRRSGPLVALVLLALAGAGCFSMSGHFGTAIPEERVAEIQSGETTREEITGWFGPPSAFYKPSLLELILASIDEDEATARIVEDVYSYRFIETRVRVAVVPLIALWARATTRTQSLAVFFDDDGRVLYYGYRVDDSARPGGARTDE